MSYDIYIGEAKINYYPEDGYMELGVKDIELDNAPEFGFGDISGKSNGRFPGYSQMSKFCETVGLKELFYDEESGFLRPHPGCKPITQDHLEIITKAKEKWEKEHPNCKELLPTKDKEPANYFYIDFDTREQEEKKYDWIYARLVWFEFWFKWALKSCKMPCISNR